jgi:dehydrogenase/reductase SDR family protein 7B
MEVYWITGASSGIGAALALELAVTGNALVLSGRNLEALQTLKAQLPPTVPCALLPFELMDIDRFPTLAQQAINAHGHVDVLVNNAGFSQRSEAIQTEASVERKILEVNYFAPVALTKAILPHFMSRKKGHVVVVSSIAGKFGFALRSSYAAAKHALHGYFEALRLELRTVPIHVTIICPGRVKTSISLHAVKGDGSEHQIMDEGQRKGITAERCAKVIHKAIRGKRYEVLAGGLELLPVYLKRFVPSIFYWLIQKVKPT